MPSLQNKQSREAEYITVQDFYDSFQEVLQLEILAGQASMKQPIKERSINRPALALTGRFEHFASNRMQLLGAGEMDFLYRMEPEVQKNILNTLAMRHVPCIIISRNLEPTEILVEICDFFSLPLLRTKLGTKDFTTRATVLLEEKFAPRTNIHGTLMDINGVGTLIRGESGIGKSECALALIERGHSLVADDFVYVRRIGERKLMGTSAELNRGYMECRGIGIINLPELFGVKCVRVETSVDLVVSFVEWKIGLDEDRTGLEENFYKILEVGVPIMEIPVRPGRDMARLVEVAALVQVNKAIGHNSAEELNQRLIKKMQDEQV